MGCFFVVLFKTHLDIFLSEIKEKLIHTALSGRFRINYSPAGEWILYVFSLDYDEKTIDESIFRAALAEVLTGLLFKELREKYVQDVIKKNYFYFTRGEKDKVYYYYKQREDSATVLRKQVLADLTDYLKNSNYLNLQGFVFFRLKYYLIDVKKNVENAVDAFLMEKEYQEFIKLLKYFVELQEPKIYEAHVMLDKDGNIQICDEGFNIVKHNNLEDISISSHKEKADGEDLLVSALVSMAPGKITVHSPINTRFPGIIVTLKKIFDHRITACTNCHYCQKAKDQYN